MKIASNKAVHVPVSDSCRIEEYRFPSDHLGIARASINGRYPEQASVVNQDCEEVYYVISGTGAINVNNIKTELKPDDVFVIRKNEQFWVEGVGLSVVVITSPPWTPDQCKQVQIKFN